MFRIFLWFLVGFGLFREVWAVGYILAGVSGFLLDFAVIKVLQKQQYKLQISQLVQNSNKNSLHEKYIKDSLTDTEEIDPEEVVNDRLSVIRGIIKNIPMHNKTVLHVGCGGKNDIEIAKAYEISGARNIGLDIHRPSIESFVRTFNTQGVIAEALNIPFSDNSFDIINATDIIEHVHDPARFLSESYRVLKNGGFLVIATPNRCRLRRNMEILNPFVFILNMIGTRFPMLLPQRELLAWHRNFSFFHTSFLYDELKELVVKAGFSVKYIRIKSYRGVLRPLRAYFEKVPLLNSLNDTVFVVAEK
ncbi:MAG: hypothetical protein A2219_01275 [Elusimicrobia bacterium RIFOXYA2_FULL_50_26]|nr:MAG: hypothetical protein A2219_01275 [Elusimicrobia bacterium RIFOXYA2_FULL_50_26]OGS24287.1 MAG: hypothetical protein A2314_07515 [Elusimicrobia bacterium RIFOXYB2_FULL_50_12]